MTYALRFLPQVKGDVWNGRTWYEAKAPGLGEEPFGNSRDNLLIWVWT